RQTKAAILSLLVQAYQRRDRVALLAFREASAELVLPPAHGLAVARRAREELPVGGATPLAEGLAATCRFLRREPRCRPRPRVWGWKRFWGGRCRIPERRRAEPIRLGEPQRNITEGERCEEDDDERQTASRPGHGHYGVG